MNYSRRQLEAFGEPLGESATRLKPGGRIYGGGGGGGPTTTTVNQSNLPDYLRPQVETVLGAGMQELFTTKKNPDGSYQITGTKPYTPYSQDPRDYVAGFSPLQQQVQANAANLQMPGQYMQGTQFATSAGQGGLDSAQQAYGYGNSGFQSGQGGQQLGVTGGGYYGGMGSGYGQQAASLAPQAQQYGQTGANIGMMGLRAEQLGRDITNQSRNYAQRQANTGNLYESMATDPGEVNRFMSPYQQAVTDVQLAAAQRQADIAAQSRKTAATRAGAFGGARQAVENAEANRALASQLDAIQAKGLQDAYSQAQGNILNRAQLGLQGLSGAQTGLNTALGGGNLGLSGIGQAMSGQQLGLAGLQGANQLYGSGMQGAQIGLQGVDRQLAGTGQGMQGAQVGLQGVSGAQAGYGIGNQSANALNTLGNSQLQGQLGLLGFQNQIGGQQQGLEQQIINQAILNFANSQEAPLNALNAYNALLRGYAVPGTTTTQYQAQPPLANQIAGLTTAGVGSYQLANTLSKKKGGKVRGYADGGIVGLGLRNAMKQA